MALTDYLLKFTKDWRNPVDFPTYENNETKVRSDMQLLFDEIKTAFNKLIVDLSASILPFNSTTEVPASNVQDAILNVQSQISSAVAGDIPERSLSGNKLVEGAITDSELSDGCVGYAALAKVDSQGFNGAVGTACINNGAVTENKLAAGSVTSAKLAFGGVGSSNIAQGAVTSAKIANAAVSSLYTNTLTAAAWVGESAPYSQAVTINGILAEDVPLIDLAPSQVYATAVNEDEQWAQIYRAVASANTITFYAKDKPTIDLVFRARCIRK